MMSDESREHDAPLLHLVRARLHANTTLRDRVIKLRWRRRRNVVANDAPIEVITSDTRDENTNDL